MPYIAEISADNPSCFLFLIYQSTSMAEEVSAGDATIAKAAGVSDTMNRWLSELSIKCAKSEGVRDYYHVGVVGYGKKVGPCLAGSSDGNELIPISHIADNPARIDERDNIRMPVWFDAVADGGTPMCRATSQAGEIVQHWLDAHPDCFPPIVIHVTDGEATDGDVLLFNIHLSANPDAQPVCFPDSPDNLPDEYSKMLWETASPLSPTMRALAKEYGIKTTDDSRGFVLNADMVMLVQAIDIGTRPANLR